MNRRTMLLLHVAVWAMLFLSPLTFLRGGGMSMQEYIMLCMTPLVMMIVFYLNYLWLTPHYFVTGKHRYFWSVNLVMVVCLGILLHYWMAFTHSLMAAGRHYPHPDPSLLDDVFFICRDIFNLTVTAAIASTIVLAQRWQHSEEARLEAETARTEAELKNLRSQINPHFLLNTLNNIYALTAFDAERAQMAIQQLSKLLRHMLYDNQQEKVKLSEEIQFLENYVSLMKIRLPASVDVTFDMNVKKNDLMIAPLIFISLVENAFKHGVSPTTPSFIHISLRTDIERVGDHDTGDIVVCCISNSNHPKTEQDRSGHGIGLGQVQRRLDLTYPNRYQWDKGVSLDGQSYTSCITLHL